MTLSTPALTVEIVDDILILRWRHGVPNFNETSLASWYTCNANNFKIADLSNMASVGCGSHRENDIQGRLSLRVSAKKLNYFR